MLDVPHAWKDASGSTGAESALTDISLQLDREKYFRGVQWVRDLLLGLEFEPDRIQVVASKMVKDVVKKRRSGMKVAGTVVRALCFQPRSNQAASSMLRQRAFLGHLLERLGTQPAQVRTLLACEAGSHLCVGVRPSKPPETGERSVGQSRNTRELRTTGPKVSNYFRDRIYIQ